MTTENIRPQKEYTMQKVLIDKFIVPKESKAPFLERTREVQSFLKTLPGFVEGFLYEKRDGERRYNYVTTAVWKMRKPLKMQRKPSPRNSKNKVLILRRRGKN